MAFGTKDKTTLLQRAQRGWPFFLAAALVIIVDQVTKFLIRSNMSLYQSIPAEGPFRLTYVFNTGASFGLFRGQTIPLLITAIIGIAALVLFFFYVPLESKLLRLALGLQLGGAAGNLIDRIRLGGVTDFLDAGFWPVFNAADSAVVIGVGLLVLFFLLPSKKPQS